jgi:hypothetical protein
MTNLPSNDEITRFDGINLHDDQPVAPWQINLPNEWPGAPWQIDLYLVTNL